MDTATRPIITTTSLSLLLHAVAIASALLLYGQSVTVHEGVGGGVEVQLVSSQLVSDQLQEDVPQAQEVKASASPDHLPPAVEKTFAEEVLMSLKSPSLVSEDKVEKRDRDFADQLTDGRQEPLSEHQDGAVAQVAQSANASQQQHTILELLHRRISDNKEYPYLARRQRREGVATVAFVLYPDGRVENAHLVASSHAHILDRAALSAVEQIEPFIAAKEYLEKSETFQVDIEFDLL
jgi:TonB family protein